ncbi:MerR family transcriptional regulator [Streptomyces sp. NPDC048172]|uniref:helix-turn-helix domain-containing protein n=1 Tax=Streptomyces sp. NPDC048172 TaxID=3365505 RepID=UPI00371528FA
MAEALTPIRAAADHFGLALSTLHYWERRGLIAPRRRAGGQRWYDTDQLYRIALIKHWRETGLMSVEDIAGLLATGPGWQGSVTERIAEIERRRAALDTAHAYLTHLLACPHETSPENCPGFREWAEVPAA